MRKLITGLFLLINASSFAQTIQQLIDQKAKAILPKVIEWRRHIHQHPELGNREFKTMEYIAAHLKQLGLEVLLELHDEEELQHICEETEIVGINNRNLKTFEVDIERSLRMAKQIPDTKIKVAESGISSVENIQLFKANGFRGFLIGENFMKEENPGKAFAAFVQQLNEKA